MYLLTVRAAVVVMAAAFVATLAFALTFSVGNVWQMAFLYGGGVFGLAVPFFNTIIPPTSNRGTGQWTDNPAAKTLDRPNARLANSDQGPEQAC